MISDHAGKASGGLWRDRRGFSAFLVIYQGRKYFLSGIEEKDKILWYNIKWNNI